MLKRRQFIQSLGLMAGATLLPVSVWAQSEKKIPIAAYLGNVPSSDLETRLGLAKEAGFENVVAPGNWMLEDDGKEIAAAIRNAGLSCPVVYAPVNTLGMRNLEEGLDRLAKIAKQLGATWFIATGVEKAPRGARRMSEYLNMYAQRLAWDKIQFAYAPHAADLMPRGAEIPLEVMIQNTERTLVNIEWNPTLIGDAGANATGMLESYPERFSVLRLGVAGDCGQEDSLDSIDWKGLKPALIVAGTPTCTDANMENAKANMEYWNTKRMKVKKVKTPKEKPVEMEEESDSK
ncbi:MAG: sugar phosphate isomerase/epimerase family protein [Bacteroidia bacterium]